MVLETWANISNHLEGLLKHRVLGHTPVSDSLGLGRGQRISISNKLPGHTDAAVPQTILEEPMS